MKKKISISEKNTPKAPKKPWGNFVLNFRFSFRFSFFKKR